MYEVQNLEKWTRPDYYMGPNWPEYYVYFARHRDSSLLTNVNFDVALEAVGGESDTVVVVRESHWAVGWVEWIGIHETDAKALEKADEIIAAYEEYPVLDEERWGEAEVEEVHRMWSNMDLEDRFGECYEAGISLFSARHEHVPEAVFDRLRDAIDG